MDEIKTYNAWEDDYLEALFLLKEAKRTGKHITINLTYGEIVETVSSTDKESTWYSKFYNCENEEGIVMRYSGELNHKFRPILSRAQLLEFQLEECKYYIYPQRAQQFLEEVDNMPEFENLFQTCCVKRIESFEKPYTDFPLLIVKLFKKVFHNDLDYNSSGEPFVEIMYGIKKHEEYIEFKKKYPHDKRHDHYSGYDRYKVFSAFIKYFPGGLELVERFDPTFLEEHKEEFKDIIEENEKFKRELLDHSIDPVITESPVEKSMQYFKKSILEMIEHIKQYGLRPCLSINYDFFSIDDVLTLLKLAKEHGEPLSINYSASEDSEHSWYHNIAEESRKDYLESKTAKAQRTEIQEKMLVEIQEQYIDQMREHIYPQRFQFWKYFVNLYIKKHEWGDPPVYLDYLIKKLADYIPKVNSGSKKAYKEVAKEIENIDGFYAAFVVNIMLFAKNGPDFVKSKFPSMYENHKRDCDRISAENAAFEEELKKHQQSFTE